LSYNNSYTDAPTTQANSNVSAINAAENEQLLFDQVRDILLQDERVHARHLESELRNLQQNIAHLRDELGSIKEELATVKEDENNPDDLTALVNPLIDYKILELKNSFYENFGEEVKNTVTRSLQESKDDFIEAMYPIIGQMISKYVRETLNTWLDEVSRQMNDVTSWTWWKQRIKAVFTGVDHAKIALNESIVAEVEEVFIIHHESGLLLGSYSRNNTADVDMIAGMLTAIKMFVNDIFAQRSDKSSLDTIEFGEYHILILNFHKYYVATVTNGHLTPNFKEQLNAHLTKFAKTSIPTSIKEVDSRLFEEVSKSLKQSFNDFEQNHA